jgi:hypothetical protein
VRRDLHLLCQTTSQQFISLGALCVSAVNNPGKRASLLNFNRNPDILLPSIGKLGCF